MDQLSKKSVSHEECVSSYDLYAQEVRGLAASTREIQRRILRRFCAFRFGKGLSCGAPYALLTSFASSQQSSGIIPTEERNERL